MLCYPQAYCWITTTFTENKIIITSTHELTQSLVPIIYKMKQLLTLLLLFITLCANCQSVDYQKIWIDSIESSKDFFNELKPENKLEIYQAFDFTSLIFPANEFYGFIGFDYTRIKMYFLSIKRDSGNHCLYDVLGATVVKDNKCDFSGTITLEKIQEYKNMKHGLDSSLFGKCKSQGILFGKYLFKENPAQKHTGTFEGLVTITWYIDNYNILHYDNIEYYSDSYKNNQYVGTWTEYGSKNHRICNWGVYRIPFSSDLDIGVGEFSPNSKYLNNGWKDLELK